MPFLKFHYKPKNELEAGGRTAALLQEDASEPEKTCPNCHKAIPLSRLWSNYNTCPCGYHFRMGGRQRLRMLVDKGTFRELFAGVEGHDPLGFPGYQEKLEQVQAASNETEGVLCGTARIGGQPCCLFIMEPYFMMGSMGTAVGEKITRLFEYATAHRRPVVGYTVSGGARMQEGLLSLMQMAKTSGAVGGTARRGCFTAPCSPTPPPAASPPALPWRVTSSWPSRGPPWALPGPEWWSRPQERPCPRASRQRNFCSSTALWTPLSPAGTSRPCWPTFCRSIRKEGAHEYPCL